MELKKQYYAVVLELWKMFREDIETIDGLNKVSSEQWDKICAKYEKFPFDKYPKNLHGYISNMLLIHISELETICRDRLHLSWKHYRD